MKTLGLDIGTTTISVVVLDYYKEEGQSEVLDALTLESNSFIHTGHDWERIQDTELIWAKAKDAVDQMLAKYKDIASIGVTGQMHGIVYTDAEGQAVSPLYTWQDGRGNLVDMYEGTAAAETLTAYVLRRTGVTAATGYGLITHLYNRKHGLVPECAVQLSTICDYMGMKLTGRARPLMHITNAASLGFFDVDHGCFLEKAFADCGGDVEILPEVTEEFDVIGTYRGIPVTAALGDNQASFLSSVGPNYHTALINMGTGGQISILSPAPVQGENIETRPFMKGSYLLVGASICGGRAYAILEKFLRSYAEAAGAEAHSQYDVMAKLADGAYAAGKTGMKVQTTFSGTRTNPDMTGSITHLTEDNFTPENLVYGVLEGMADELCEMYRIMAAGVTAEQHILDVHKLVGSGNGLRRNPVLQQIFCDRFGARMELSSYNEEAACGAAISSRMHTARP